MKKYDAAISKMIPDRIFFFPTSSNKGYPDSWVRRIFKICRYKNNQACNSLRIEASLCSGKYQQLDLSGIDNSHEAFITR
jgi:hypothetical protein